MLSINTNSQHFTSQLKGHVDIAKVLIRNGADVKAVDGEELTVLHLWLCMEECMS